MGFAGGCFSACAAAHRKIAKNHERKFRIAGRFACMERLSGTGFSLWGLFSARSKPPQAEACSTKALHASESSSNPKLPFMVFGVFSVRSRAGGETSSREAHRSQPGQREGTSRVARGRAGYCAAHYRLAREERPFSPRGGFTRRPRHQSKKTR